MKKCSILLSVYKPNKKYLKEQLKSLNNQTYKNIEVIIHDDCPTDRCDIKIFEQCLTKVPYKILPYLDENLGYIKAFERLVQNVTRKNSRGGGYIAFCDQDDIWMKTKVEDSIRESERLNACLVVSNRMQIDSEGKIICKNMMKEGKRRYLTWKTGDDIAKYNAFTCHSPGMCLLITTDLAKKIIPFPIGVGHDRWIISCALGEGIVARLEKVEIKQRRHGENASKLLDDITNKKEYFQSFRYEKAYVDELKRKYPNYPNMEEIDALATARVKKNIFKMWKYRYLHPRFTEFEIFACLVPNFVFKNVLKLIRKKCNW